MPRRFRAALLVCFFTVAASCFALAPRAEAAAPHFAKTSLPPQRPATVSAQAVAASGPFPYADTFRLHSLPGALRSIYLDFDGETVSGTAWNDEFTGGNAFHAEAYDIDGDAASFSHAELDVIQTTWQRVAEDFAPFGVDVTTEDPGLAAIERVGSTDLVFGTKALITNTSMIYDSCGCAGVGYIGTFDLASSHRRYQPAFVFGRALGAYDKDLGDVISHEVGHNLGVEHDGKGTDDYYTGHGAWAPLMGAGYLHPITQWSKGEYLGATNGEDDLVLMQHNGAPLRTDDYANGTSSAAPFAASGTAKGIIGSDADVDVFSFASPGGSVTFSATPAPKGPNLDIKLELLTASGVVVASSDPVSAQVNYDNASGLSASVTASTAAGTYYVRVQGVGAGDPTTTGYSSYGSIGEYTLTGPAMVAAVTPPTMAINDIVVAEGAGGTTPVATFTVSLSAASATAVTAWAATTNGTAYAGSDYAAKAAAVTVPAGQTSATFAVTLLGDSTPETHERFSVALSSPTGAALADATGLATVMNDDGIGFSVSDVTRYEGTSSTSTIFSFTVALSNVAPGPMSVIVTTLAGSASGGGSDFNGKRRTVYFAGGERTKTFTVVVRADAVSEPDEAFYVSLSSPTGRGARITDRYGRGLIRNDD